MRCPCLQHIQPAVMPGVRLGVLSATLDESFKRWHVEHGNTPSADECNQIQWTSSTGVLHLLLVPNRRATHALWTGTGQGKACAQPRATYFKATEACTAVPTCSQLTNSTKSQGRRSLLVKRKALGKTVSPAGLMTLQY